MSSLHKNMFRDSLRYPFQTNTASNTFCRSLDFFLIFLRDCLPSGFSLSHNKICCCCSFASFSFRDVLLQFWDFSLLFEIRVVYRVYPRLRLGVVRYNSTTSSHVHAFPTRFQDFIFRLSKRVYPTLNYVRIVMPISCCLRSCSRLRSEQRVKVFLVQTDSLLFMHSIHFHCLLTKITVFSRVFAVHVFNSHSVQYRKRASVFSCLDRWEKKRQFWFFAPMIFWVIFSYEHVDAGCLLNSEGCIAIQYLVTA